MVGHVHRPELHNAPGGACVLVPGSVQAIHPKEPGVHGPWLMDVDRSREEAVRVGQIAASTVRYETVEVDLEGVDDVAGLESRVTDAVRARRDLVMEQGNATTLRHLSCTLLLSGRTAVYRVAQNEARRALADLELGRDGLTVRADRIFSEARPAVDLDDLARGKDPAAILAQYLVRLESPEASTDPQLAAMIEEGRCAIETVYRAKPYQDLLDDETPDTEEARALLIAQGYRLLDALVAQKESA